MRRNPVTKHVILSGCSGGGKSTLLAELGRRGYLTVAEPGRRIVAEEPGGRGAALPWVDLETFARRAIEMATADRNRVAAADGWVFFDRGLVDAAVALEHVTGLIVSETLAGLGHFHDRVFLTPPWPEMYRTDRERRLELEQGIAEYHRLHDAYLRLGYDPVILPKISVEARADFVLNCLS